MERDPEAASAEYIAQLLSDVGKIILRKVVDAAVCTSPLEFLFDKYAGSWPGDEFKKHDIMYAPSELPKSGLYLDLLPALNSGRVELPPDNRLVNQLISLERRTARGGRDRIDHAPGSHDDRANVIAGLVSTRAASTYDLELFINGCRAGDKKTKRTHTSRRPVIEALRRAGIPLN